MGLKSPVGKILHIKTQLQWQIVGELMYRCGTIVCMYYYLHIMENKHTKYQCSRTNSFELLVFEVPMG